MQDSYQLTTVKAIWDFLEVFYVDKNAASWLPERLVDWLAVSYKPGRTPPSSLYMLKDTSCFKFHVQCTQWWVWLTALCTCRVMMGCSQVQLSSQSLQIFSKNCSTCGWVWSLIPWCFYWVKFFCFILGLCNFLVLMFCGLVSSLKMMRSIGMESLLPLQLAGLILWSVLCKFIPWLLLSLMSMPRLDSCCCFLYSVCVFDGRCTTSICSSILVGFYLNMPYVGGRSIYCACMALTNMTKLTTVQ